MLGLVGRYKAILRRWLVGVQPGVPPAPPAPVQVISQQVDLQPLRSQVARLEGRIGAQSALLAALREPLERREQRIRDLEAELDELRKENAQHTVKAMQAFERGRREGKHHSVVKTTNYTAPAPPPPKQRGPAGLYEGHPALSPWR